MKISRAILFILLPFACALLGQAAEEPDSQPSPALDRIALKPVRACWEETLSGEAGLKQPMPAKIVTVAFDGLESIETTFTNGKVTKKWRVGAVPLTLAKIEGREEVLIDYDYLHEHRNKLPKIGGRERFSGLEWISAVNYRGIAAFGGADCWYFKTSDASATGPEAASTVRKAWVDVKTGLPAARVEEGMQIVYRFEVPPASSAAFPPVVLSYVKRYREKMSRYCPGEF